MSISEVLMIMKNSLIIMFIVMAPLLLISLIVGLIVSIFQAVTSIQEMTLAYVPKIMAIILGIIFLGPFLIKIIITYSVNLIKDIPNIIR